MDIYKIIILILTIIVIAMNISLIIYLSVMMRKHDKVPVEDTGTSNMKYMLYETDKFLNFLKDICTQVSLLKFYVFINGKDLSKITEAQIKALIEDCSHTIMNNIQESNIDISKLLITKEYYEFYIINLVIYNINKLLEESLQ